MKRSSKIAIEAALSATACAVQLYRGFAPAVPLPGDIPAGAANEPFAVVFAALLSGALVWLAAALLLRLFSGDRRK